MSNIVKASHGLFLMFRGAQDAYLKSHCGTFKKLASNCEYSKSDNFEKILA